MILIWLRGAKALGDSYGTGPDPTLGVPRISAKIICPDRPPYSSVGDEVLLSDCFRGGDRPGATLSLDPAAFVGTDPLLGDEYEAADTPRRPVRIELRECTEMRMRNDQASFCNERENARRLTLN